MDGGLRGTLTPASGDNSELNVFACFIDSSLLEKTELAVKEQGLSFQLRPLFLEGLGKQGS